MAEEKKGLFATACRGKDAVGFHLERTLNLIGEHSPAALGVYLLTLGWFYTVIRRMGYTFIPLPIFGDVCSGVLIIWLTNKAIDGGNKKTAIDTVFSILLPLTAVFFIVSKWKASGLVTMTILSHSIHSCLTLVCSLKLFIFRIRGKARQITAWIVLAGSLVIAVLFMALSFAGNVVGGLFGVAVTEIAYEISPKGVYLGRIMEGDAGAAGGSTTVLIVPQKRVYLLFGLLRKGTQTLTGRWGEYRTLRWETDEILYVNGVKYIIKNGELRKS